MCNILITTALSIVLLVFLPIKNSFAQCSRADIDHYLEKGFSHQQVIKLCAPSNNSKEKNIPEKSAQLPDNQNNYQDRHAEKVIAKSLDAKDIYLTSTDLHLTQQKCLEFGRPNPNGIRKKFCPLFKYKISRKNLKVLRIEKPHVFSKKKILSISGQVHIQLMSRNQYRLLKKQLIHQYISKTKVIKIALTPRASEEKLRRELSNIKR